jgi:hypothetical protein
MSADFWSRRREAVAREERAEEAAVLVAEEAERERALAEVSDEELLEEAGLMAPEELDSPEAVREFLASALPQRLKTRALRRLWRLNPVLANVDGLVDYGEDFTDGAKIIENMQTAYQVGKGMLKHVEELARQAEAEEADEDEALEFDVAEASDDEQDDAAPVEVAAVENAQPEVAEEVIVDEPDFLPASRRRMTFTFTEQRTG